MDREYQGLIFTKHALERAQDRGITQDMVANVVSHPDNTYPGEKKHSAKFIRELNGRQVHVVANFLPDKKQWLVISVWVRGEEDKAPIMWLVLTFPFKIGWSVTKKIAKKIKIHIQ